jgi:hypothetical protein
VDTSRLHRRRRRHGRLRRGRTLVGERPRSRTAARSGRFGPSILGARADRLRAHLQRSGRELDVRSGTRGLARRRAQLLATRQGARRFRLDQRDGVCARPACRLRRLESARQRRLGLERCAAAFPAIEDRGDGVGAESAGHVRGCAAALRITDVSAQAHPLVRAYIEACGALGFPFTADFNGAQPEGVGIYQITTRNGLRDSTATAWLRPALRRSPTCNCCSTRRCMRIEFEARRATGVQYQRGNRWLSVRANKAVVLCAGSGQLAAAAAAVWHRACIAAAGSGNPGNPRTGPQWAATCRITLASPISTARACPR